MNIIRLLDKEEPEKPLARDQPIPEPVIGELSTDALLSQYSKQLLLGFFRRQSVKPWTTIDEPSLPTEGRLVCILLGDVWLVTIGLMAVVKVSPYRFLVLDHVFDG